MRPISKPMCANRFLLAAFFSGIAALGFFLAPAFAADSGNLGAHRTANPAEFQQVLEKKCIVCHTQERIDIAIKARRSLEKIQQRMIERGAELSERDKSVLGTFWGSPLRQIHQEENNSAE